MIRVSPYSWSPQASTGELLSCLSNFLRHRCVKLKELSSNQIVLWFRKVDRALLVQGWQVGGPPVQVEAVLVRRCLVTVLSEEGFCAAPPSDSSQLLR